MKLFKLTLLLSLAFMASGCMMKMYNDEKVVGPSGKLTLEVEAKTIMARYLTAHLYDYKKIANGEACGQKGLIFKEPIIRKSAFMGAVAASSKKEGTSIKLPAGPVRVYLDFTEGGGNTFYTNYADVVLMVEPKQEYVFGYKRAATGMGEYYFKQKKGKGYVDVKKMGSFDMSVCVEHLEKRKSMVTTADAS